VDGKPGECTEESSAEGCTLDFWISAQSGDQSASRRRQTYYDRADMKLRQQSSLRALARRLPVISAYECRLAETTQNVADLDRAFAEYREAHRTWAPIGHFYSPFVDLEGLKEHHARIDSSDVTVIPAVNLRIDEQRALFAQLSDFAAAVEFSKTEADSRANGRRYWVENPAYGDTDARFLTAMLHHFKPRRLMELGCGYSSAVTLDARDRYLESELEITFLDPYPQLLESLVRESDRSSVTIMPIGTQHVDLDLIAELGENDVLFIDSTHVSKTGSDVNRIFFEILPAVRPGVLIHLHDIFPRFEYPPDWVQEGRAWTEQYVLRAFLQYNTAFEIVMWPGLLWALDAGSMVDNFPAMATNAGGAFWMRRLG
jgi:Methyltransferase domain